MPDFVSNSGNLSADNHTLALVRQLESLLNSRLEPWSLRLLMSLPKTYSSFRLVNGELGFKVSLLTKNNRLRMELEAALTALEEASRLLPDIGLAEALTLRVRNAAWSVIESDAPLFLVRPALRVLARLQTGLSLHADGARGYHDVKAGALSEVLQEPQLETAKLIREHLYYLYWNYARRLRHLSNSSASDALVPDFYWAERTDYSAMTSACKDSRVLVTIHMGDFFGALKCIAEEMTDSRSVMSLRREGETESIRNLSQRVANNHQVLMHGKDNPVRIVKALRAGDQTLSVMFDLGGNFGETTEVVFFGHRARFVRGPAELAILGRARIYPFVCFEDAGSYRIRMEPSFFPKIQTGESLQDAVTRVTQTLVSLAERWIRMNPAQWKYLDRLPTYLVLDERGPCADEGEGTLHQRGAVFDA